MVHPFRVDRDPCVEVRIREVLTPEEAGELAVLVPGAVPGGMAVVGLRELFGGAHLFADLLVAQPPVEAMWRRLLAAMTVRVGRLDTRDGEVWLDAREDLLERGRFDPDAVGAYFDPSPERWWLFGGPRPFLQDPRLDEEGGDPAAPGRLVMSRASGANALWSDGTPQDVPVGAAESVAWLLGWYGFGPSGTNNTRRHGGRSTHITKAGPYRSLISYFPHLPGSLFASLVLSVPAPSAWPQCPGPDLAPWETAQLPDPLAVRPPAGPVSLLAGRTAHAVLLCGDGENRTVGCRATWATLTDLPPATDPYVIERDTGGPVRADRGRHLWRDLDALLLHQRAGDKATWRRPTVFDHLAELDPDLLARLGVRALGWEQEGRDRNFAWYSATTPPVLHHLAEADPDGAAAIAAARDSAEGVSRALYGALANAWDGAYPKRESKEKDGFVNQGRARYWAAAEAEFWAVLSDLGRPPAFRSLAVEAFDASTTSLKATGHGRRAIAQSRAQLTRPRPARTPGRAPRTPA
ncbi:type I-E CRISPR-associated protein Cse1/CasA [Streptomyces sp. NPDC087440]|uniref:type I-E CRISPR-associated protein Cse1/CasA n=1 Tax=Streptomyces sp. NPDC087440 TaxID=3365790 RepID=UPI0038087EB8